MDPRNWYVQQVLAKTAEALRSNYFDSRVCEDREQVLTGVLGFVQTGMKVGFGGSITVREVGLVERVRASGAIVLDHWKEGLTPGEIAEIRLQQLTCDVFVTGTNAITEKGEIVNTDGIGNRVNSMTFGPKKVIILAGYNKIVPDVSAALERIKNYAAPMNAKRLGLPLPCATSGHCHDCKSEQRICRIVSILQRKPGITDVSVFLIKEKLGY
jgi:uncharacterized protein (DUF342 family)